MRLYIYYIDKKFIDFTVIKNKNKYKINKIFKYKKIIIVVKINYKIILKS